MPTAVQVSAEVAIIFILIVVVLPILWWIILTLSGRIGRGRR
jgi:hypothetical protein